MAMSEKHARHFAGSVLGPVEIARDEESRRALEVHLLDRVIGSVDLAVNHGV
jgi:hypothetical protein